MEEYGENLPLQAQLIVESIKRTFLAEVLNIYNRSPDELWVTELTKCLRYSFYNRVLLSSMDFRAAYRIIRGRLYHEFVTSSIPLGETEQRDSLGKKAMFRARNGKEITITGRADLAVGDYVVDLKTVTRLPKEAYSDHLAQIQLYLYLYDKPRGLLVYIDDGGRIKPVHVERNEDEISKLLRRAEELYEALRTGTPPPPEEDKWCRYCPWNTPKLCKGKG